MHAHTSVLFALYSLGDIPVCFLKYRPKKDWSGKRYLSAISFSDMPVDCNAIFSSNIRFSSMISLAESSATCLVMADR